MALPWKNHKTMTSVLKEHYKNPDSSYAKDFAERLMKDKYAEVIGRRGGAVFKARIFEGRLETKKYKT